MHRKLLASATSLAVIVLFSACLAAGGFAPAAASHRPADGRTVSADNPNPPSSPAKLIFIHHSCGEYWLEDGNGRLGIALRDNNYFVSDTNYGWGTDSIGSDTDIGHWWTWFRGPNSSSYLSELYAESGQNSSYSRRASDPGGQNEIVMFKSCYPNSALTGSMSDPIPPIGSNPLRGGSGPLTVANCRGIYIDLLDYFRTRPDKLFVVITAPPERSLPSGGAPDRAFNNWLVNDWLDGYAYNNVFVFDFYNVLTSNGGDANTNDFGQAGGNHHRWWNGAIQHKTDGGSNVLAYPTGDDHPSSAGNQKASAEFAPLLNVAYNQFKTSSTGPQISSISPTSASVPATVTIKGSRFGSTPGGSFVSFNGTRASGYGSWSESQVICTAPAETTSGPVTVTTADGTSNEVPFTVAKQSWYLAEGCTGSNSQGSFETWVLVQNPGTAPANIDIVFQTDSGESHGPQEQIPARSRKSYRANDYVTSFNVSTKVNADADVVCERAMYGDNGTWAHDSIGTTAPAAEWFLAEGCTDGGFETWVLVQNPGSVPAAIDMVFQTDTRQVQGPQETIPANSRRSYNAGDFVTSYNVSTRVTATSGQIVCERAMYGNGRQWAHESIGARATAYTWYLAEGSTNGGFETWVLVQNPGSEATTVSLTYMTPAGSVKGPSMSLPANSRKTFFVADAVPDQWQVSTAVTADRPVVAERAMYGGGRIWAHGSIGATAPADTWYMAEGCTAEDYETWVLVQNPGDTPAAIDMVFQTDTGQVQGPREALPARSRKTYNVLDYVESYNVSTMVTATSGKVVCERAMYGNDRTWADDSIGYTP